MIKMIPDHHTRLNKDIILMSNIENSHIMKCNWYYTVDHCHQGMIHKHYN